MSAYAVFVREQTTNSQELEIYGEQAPEANKGFPLVPLALYGKHQVLEGGPIEGAVILAFPSMADAKAWYDSPAYQRAAAHRHAGASYRVFLVEGVDPEPKS